MEHVYQRRRAFQDEVIDCARPDRICGHGYLVGLRRFRNKDGEDRA